VSTGSIVYDEAGRVAKWTLGKLADDPSMARAKYKRNRANVLNKNTHDAPLVAHVASSEHQTFPYKRLLKSCLQHLVDAVINAHIVCRHTFKRDAFKQLFPLTMQLLLEQLENYLFGCYDALCILLMIKVTRQLRRSAQSRTIHSFHLEDNSSKNNSIHCEDKPRSPDPLSWSFGRLGRMSSSTSHIQQ
jgi:hypothetical protein